MKAAVAELDAVYAAQIDILQVQMELAAAGARSTALLKAVKKMRASQQGELTEAQIAAFAKAAAQHKKRAESLAAQQASLVAQRALLAETAAQLDELAAELTAPQEEEQEL
jgi:hypothetical protein